MPSCSIQILRAAEMQLAPVSESGDGYLMSSTGEFLLVLENCILVSESRIGLFHTGRQRRALFVFAKLISHAISMGNIYENYAAGSAGFRLLDHFSLAVLCRSIIDAALVTKYIANSKDSKEKWNLKRHVIYLHDLLNRRRFLMSIEKSSGQSDVAFLSSYEGVKRDLRKKISILADELGYSGDDKRKLTSGQLVFVDGARGAAREAGWDVDLFDFHQSYLSNWVHSHPVSFLRADEHGISFDEPSQYQRDFSAMIFEIASGYMGDVRSCLDLFTENFSSDPLGQVD